MAGYKKNLDYLKEHLNEGEEVRHSCYGAYETKVLNTDSVREGVLACTENRVIFFGVKLFGFGFDLESFPYSNISAIEFSKGLMGAKINLTMSGNTAKLKWISKGNPNDLVGFVRDRMGANTSVGGGDVISQIESLAKLNSQGILTDEEFSIKKAELLDRM
jgi:hypothetical protein